MPDSKLRVVYTECDADADVRQLIRSSAGLFCFLMKILLIIMMAMMMITTKCSSSSQACAPHPGSGQLPPHDSIDHVILLKSRSIFTNILKGTRPACTQ
jgi:hypothetical protein